MCSYLTVPTDIAGSAKGAQGWFAVTSAQVYFDHPFHAPVRPHAQHRLRRPGARAGRARRRRAQCGVGAPPGREHQRGARRRRGRRLVTTPTGPAAGVHLPWARGARGGEGRGRPASAAVHPRPSVTSRAGSRRVRPRSCSGRGAPSSSRRSAPTLNPDSPDIHRREAVVSAALPRSPRFPRLLDVYDDGDWVALAFEAVDGRPPPHPWEPASSTPVMAALSALHDELTPSPAAVPDSRWPGTARHLFGGWADAGRRGRPAGRSTRGPRRTSPAWPSSSRAGPTPSRVRRSSTATSAPTTCCSAGDGVVFVDWPHAAVGDPGLRRRRRGRPRWCWRAGPRPRSSWPATGPRGRLDPDVVTVLLAAVSGLLRVALAAPAAARPADAARLPGRAGRGGAGLAPPPHRLVTARTACPAHR